MQGASRTGAQPASVKIYNAVYSSVQVYECMVRGIAVMRRRTDSYVNATQILKVAGVDKGRRTKILEREILPGKHEIVQGGYGKYQGTWIPLERGRELASQYGIGPLLSPLFDFIPSTSTLGGLPVGGMTALTPRPLSASASLPPPNTTPAFSSNGLGPAPILPGSALRLLNQGRAQGLFTPSTTILSRPTAQPNGYYSGLMPGFSPGGSPAQPALKRNRTENELDGVKLASGSTFADIAVPELAPSLVSDGKVDGSQTSADKDEEGSPSKRARTLPPSSQLHSPAGIRSAGQLRAQTSTPQLNQNGVSRPSLFGGSPVPDGSNVNDRTIRFATKLNPGPNADRSFPFKSAIRSNILNLICKEDNPDTVLNLLREVHSAEHGQSGISEQHVNPDVTIDDLGHTPLHLAASLARLKTVDTLIKVGADIHRGNHQGETPLIRAVLTVECHDTQLFPALMSLLYPSIRTIDTAKRSVIHHITSSAGVKGRAAYARYYMEGVLTTIAEHDGGDFRSIVDLQDEHGDTALNIAARVGNRSLVRSLLDVGANRILANKLGLKPGDFGVEPEELAGVPRAEDLLSSLRSVPSIPLQKSQDVIADITSLVQNLSADFTTEIKSKQDAFDVTQAHLRAATRELAEQRRHIQLWQSRCAQLDQVMQRTRNLEKALADEGHTDWLAQKDVQNTQIGSTAPAPAAAPTTVPPTEVSPILLPSENSAGSLSQLRRIRQWQSHVDSLVNARMEKLKGASAEKEFQCKKIVAMCTGVHIDKVEDMLDNLVIALESESQIADIGRVSVFMQKVRDGMV